MSEYSAQSFDTLGSKDFQRLAEFIHGYSGIRVPPAKKTMVEGRLRRRVRALGLPDFANYCHYIFDEGGLDSEAVHLIDSITTNKTDFFREPDHFHFLTETVLPDLVDRHHLGVSRPLTVWSAASSIGAEPYTIAMVAAAWGEKHRGFRFQVLATDICTDVLATAVDAIYPADMIDPVPADLRQRFIMRAKAPRRAEVRIVPELRRMVHFGRLNLMDETYPVDTGIGVIFCRNILIYFDKDTQERVLKRLCRHLMPGGYLFVGHSETLTGLDLPLRPVASAVYQRL